MYVHIPDSSFLDIHATNVAIQKKSPNYRQEDGCKWSLQSLKAYLKTKHSISGVTGLFENMEVLIIRSLLGVKDKISNDPDHGKCFEVYASAMYSHFTDTDSIS